MTDACREASDGLAGQRRTLEAWLRMLCGQPVPLHAIPASIDTVRPFLSNLGLHLPGTLRAVRGAAARRTYLASAAHAAAHLAFGAHRYEVGQLRGIQRAVLGVLEDARVERLAIARMPGLAALWRPHHEALPGHGGEFIVLLARLARALFDEDHADPHPWVAKGRRLFDEAGGGRAEPGAIRDAASRLGNDVGQMRLRFNEKTYVVEPAYRDDNAWIWAHPPQQAEHAEAARQEEGTRSREGEPHAPPREDPRGERVTAERSQGGVRRAGAMAAPGSVTEPLSLLGRHAEWDRLIGAYRPEWCTVVEAPAPPGEPDRAEAILVRRQALVGRMHRLLRNSRLDRSVRRRAQPDGDALDLDAAIAAAIDRRAGLPPERGAYLRTERRRRELSVLLLADLSASTRDTVPGAGTTVLELTREACLLAGLTIGLAGDRCAVHGFCSNGRKEVRYTRFKGFDEPLDEAVRARIAGMQGRLSTRMGAALRHAAREIAGERADRRMVLVVTDGEPHDVDIHDRAYLVEDARRAVLEAARQGIGIFCVTLAAGADAWAGRIFGRGRYLVLDRIESLPVRLSEAFLRITRQG